MLSDLDSEAVTGTPGSDVEAVTGTPGADEGGSYSIESNCIVTREVGVA